MVGGFMGVGAPERLLDEVVCQQKTGLSLSYNDAAVPGRGRQAVRCALVSQLTATHIGLNPKAQQQMLSKQIAVDLVPQGTFAERIRAGGCERLTPDGRLEKGLTNRCERLDCKSSRSCFCRPRETASAFKQNLDNCVRWIASQGSLQIADGA